MVDQDSPDFALHHPLDPSGAVGVDIVQHLQMTPERSPGHLALIADRALKNEEERSSTISFKKILALLESS